MLSRNPHRKCIKIKEENQAGADGRASTSRVFIEDMGRGCLWAYGRIHSMGKPRKARRGEARFTATREGAFRICDRRALGRPGPGALEIFTVMAGAA